ncbi:MAG: DUF4384 domain-containing protein [Candidatus Sumerlaeia bacterium]|nr:DUF4384 domain-containing protein [Candidatus Sumerlaeia bacterium]
MPNHKLLSLLLALGAFLAAFVAPAAAQRAPQPIDPPDYESDERRIDDRWEREGEPLEVRIDSSKERYTIGQDVVLYLETNRDARVWVFSEDDRGATRVLFPNAFDQDNRLRASRGVRIPAGSYRLTAGPPEGRRKLLAVALDERIDVPRFRFPRSTTRAPFPVIDDLETFLREAREAADDADRRPIRPFSEDEPWNAVERPGYDDGNVEGGFDEDILLIRVGQSGGADYADEPPAHDPGSKPGSLEVRSNVQNAEVFLNGRYWGRTPFEAELRPGSYDLLVRREGYVPYRTKLNIRAGYVRTVSVRLLRE